ncbi:MAG: cyclase family protein [Clostridia bacterium]|nr:cyclase family protein [Clostridia bacterium]
MCAHNGAHIDAPSHFIEKGKNVDEIYVTIQLVIVMLQYITVM